MSFKLHKQLDKDTFKLGEFDLCKVLLMNNSLYPWIIMVPKKPDLVEITDLSDEDYITLMSEIHYICAKMQEIFLADKMNIGALGNMVPQLHVHVIARFKDDAAWPNPVWGQASEKYTEKSKAEMFDKLSAI